MGPSAIRALAGVLVAAVLAAMPAGPAAAQGAGTTAIVAVNNAPPYRIIEHAGGTVRLSGIYVDIVRDMARRADLALEFQEVPFRRALKLMEDGRADIMVGPNRTPEREGYLYFLDVPLTAEAKAFYGRPGSAPVAGYGDLAGKRIAVLRGATYFPPFDGDAALSKVETADYPTAVRLVAGGRVDLVVMPELLGDHLVKVSGAPLVKGTYRAPGRPSYIAVSRRAHRIITLVPVLERALSDAIADGTVNRILESYR
ncbi:MAG: transporter substrate-binding domain-containing protein [Hyphomicrobiales bacterium]|nr:transporter substrate-binding domain-containing protein [Hyphomicrobiales bacterium]